MDGARHSRICVHRHDDALGCWTVATCEPCAPLRPFVQALWLGQGQVSYQRDRILPNACGFLLINLGPPQYRIDPGPPERRVTFEDIWLSGLHTRPIETEAPHGSAILGVAFGAAGIRPWLHMDAGELDDQVLPLASLLGNQALDLRARLLGATTVEKRFAMLERWLLARLATRYAAHPVVGWAVDRLARSGGQLGIEQLAHDCGFSRKFLGTVFQRDVGLSPKALARVQRFQAALTLLAGRQRMPWSELAAHCGYYDQSHLVRDFQRFSGLPPGEFLRKARPDATSVVVA